LLAIGGAIGGVIGKGIFNIVKDFLSNDNILGAIQASLLLVLTIGVVLYIKFRKYIKGHNIKNAAVCIIVGLTLGIISSFLGIGGGPFNVVALYWIFSMDAKTAAKNSIFIIFLSQIFSLITTVVSKTIPEFSISILIFMVIGGITGGFVGTALLKKIHLKHAQNVFVLVLVIIIGINAFNLYNFLTL